jgi:hypothetical protein
MPLIPAECEVSHVEQNKWLRQTPRPTSSIRCGQATATHQAQCGEKIAPAALQDLVAYAVQAMPEEPRKLPLVLNPERVARLLGGGSRVNYKAALSAHRRALASRRTRPPR